jgi:hypothetical protein
VLSTLKHTLEQPQSGWQQVEAVRLLAVYTRQENVMRYLETKQGQAEAERDKRFEVKLGTGPAENKAEAPDLSYHGPPLSGFVEKPKRKRRKKKSEEPSEEETSG